MQRNVSVGVVGASGSLGQQVVEVLDEAPWKPERLVPMARANSLVSSVSFRGRDVAVDDVAHAAWDDLDVVIVAVPPAVAAPIVAAASAAGAAVVDCSGSQLADLAVPMVVPWINGDLLDGPRSRDVVVVPSGPAIMLASVLSGMSRAGWRGSASATVMVGASFWGRDGVDEMSKQVVALFNSATPPRRVFEGGLAFDLMPLVGTAGATGWTDMEVRTAAELGRVTGVRCDVTLVGVPVFSGMGATFRLGASSDWTVERVIEALAASGVEMGDGGGARRITRPRRVEGSSLVHGARVRVSISEEALHIWLALDNLRAAAAAAVAVAGKLVSQRGSDD